MKINELRGAQLAKPAAITEAVHQPQNGGGRIYDAISRNIDMISAEEKQDIISLLQATGGAAKSKRQSRQQPTQPAATPAAATPAASQSPEQKFAARRAAAAATARANMTPYSPINTGGAVWRNNRKPDQSGRTRPGAIEEAKKKITAKDDPCWSGYHMVGTKQKGGREVPNCVPGKKGS